MEIKLRPDEEDEPPSSLLSQQPSPVSEDHRAQDVRQDQHARHAVQATFPFYSPHPALVRRPKRLIHKLPISARANAFRRRVFPESTASQWNDWHWQLRNRVRSLEGLSRFLNLTMDEMTAILRHRSTLPLSITPYYSSLLDPDEARSALRRTVVPVNDEYLHLPGEAEDPLGEDTDSPVPGLVHRYPDRVLFLVTNFCSSNCRYCTRSRMIDGTIGEEHRETGIRSRWERAIQYIEDTPRVRDVLISGGDPLTLSDEKLEWLLKRLRAISHVELIRIGSKVPVVLPQRITPELTRMLRRYHPVWMSIHFTHPQEITPEVSAAVSRLADAGIPLGSQTVLLAGINDDVDTMKCLYHGLLRIRVKPYYLYQCDPIIGSSHFRTSVRKGLEIIEGLRGHTSGYAVPQYVIDAPGGGGKIPLLPEYLVGRDGDALILRNFEGRTFRYPDPVGDPAGDPVGQPVGHTLGDPVLVPSDRPLRGKRR